MGDDPPFLPVGTDVSAKYKGAFCEAKIKKVVRNIKCKLTLKAGGTLTVNDDVIKGNLRVGNTVEVKQDTKKDAIEAVIGKIQDCSQYTVVFDDGDITTLRRSALCLKSGRHFNESETLDQLPLTHPEHFSTPVIAGRRGRRARQQSPRSDDSDSDVVGRRMKSDSTEREPHVGRVVLVESASGAERRRPHQPAFPALVVAPTPQIKVKEDYLVRSFKDGRYYTVPKKEAREFRKGSAPTEWSGVEAALQYLNNGVLPPHWEKDGPSEQPPASDSSDDEPREEKDHFVAQLYKFMDDRGTPLNRNPTIANKDIDLYRLFRVVEKLGGYNRVTNQNQWKTIADKMGFHPVTTSITNMCKQAYRKFLRSFEDFYRKLGVTLVAHPRGARTPPAGRSLIRDRDKLPPATPPAPAPSTTQRKDGRDSDKSEAEKNDKSEKEEVIEKAKDKQRISDGEDSADNQPLAVTAPKIDKEKEKEREKEREKEKEKEKEKEREKEKEKEREKEKEKEREKEREKEKQLEKERQKEKEREKEKEKEREKERVKEKEKEKEREREKEKEKEREKEKEKEKEAVAEEKSKLTPLPKSRISSFKLEPHEKRTPKRKLISSKDEHVTASTSRASRRPHASTDSDSSGRASRCGGLGKKMQGRRSQSANSASSGNTVTSTGSKRPRKRINIDNRPSSTNEPIRSAGVNVKAQVGDKLKVYYGPTQSESKVTYEAKVIEISPEGQLRVHYTGWNTRYDEWIKPQRIALNVTQHEIRNKKGTNTSRRVRAKRIEESSARSDTDSDSSDEDVKRLPKKSEDKSGNKLPKNKDGKSSDSSSSSKPRKRPLRSVSTPSNASPPKKLRPPSSGHQGRDYDLNEIRSELKGLQTVKQEPEDVKQELSDKETSKSPPSKTEMLLKSEDTSTIKTEKQPEDVYEFKEPEPFELELHEEKKKRTHRIFDDISPTKYTSALSKSLSEEISDVDPLRPRNSLRSPSLSPFREFGATRDASASERQSPEDDSKDALYSLDDDSFPGDGSSGPIFEGFTPAKNQETYSKKSKVSKLRELIDDSPDSPADDEQSSDDEPGDVITKEEEERDPTPPLEIAADVESLKSPKNISDDKQQEEIIEEEKPEEAPIIIEEAIEISIPESPKNSSPTENNSPITVISNTTACIASSSSTTIVILATDDNTEETMTIDLDSIPLPSSEPLVKPKFLLEESFIVTESDSILNDCKPLVLEPEPILSQIEPPSSPLVDTEEDKSEPDSPARIDVLPEPPPGFLLQSEGPKIAEKLLKAINSAKRLSISPPPIEEKSLSPILIPRQETLPVKTDDKLLSPTPAEVRSAKLERVITPKAEVFKSKQETNKKADTNTLFGEPLKIMDKIENIDKKTKPEESTTPRLSPLNIIERRKSIADLSLSASKNNKVLSDTIQKLSSQINQSVANIPLPPFPPTDRHQEETDSDDSDEKLIIDKAPAESWSNPAPVEPSRPLAPIRGPLSVLSSQGLLEHGPHAGKSPGEWSAGESLLMLEDACKNERKHSASVVVAGRDASTSSGSAVGPVGAACVGSAEDEGSIALLLCGERIPRSPAPDPRQRAEERREDAGAGGAGAGGGWPRHALLDNTPPTTPDTSPDLSPTRERRTSERDSPMETKDEDEENRPNDAHSYDMEKPLRGRSRKASESCSNRGRGRRRRDTDDNLHVPLKYNFYVELDPSWDCQTRINVLTSRLGELRKAYHSVKAELAAVDRRRKKLRRKEREAVKAAKAACS